MTESISARPRSPLQSQRPRTMPSSLAIATPSPSLAPSSLADHEGCTGGSGVLRRVGSAPDVVSHRTAVAGGATAKPLPKSASFYSHDTFVAEVGRYVRFSEARRQARPVSPPGSTIASSVEDVAQKTPAHDPLGTSPTSTLTEYVRPEIESLSNSTTSPPSATSPAGKSGVVPSSTTSLSDRSRSLLAALQATRAQRTSPFAPTSTSQPAIATSSTDTGHATSATGISELDRVAKLFTETVPSYSPNARRGLLAQVRRTLANRPERTTQTPRSFFDDMKLSFAIAEDQSVIISGFAHLAKWLSPAARADVEAAYSRLVGSDMRFSQTLDLNERSDVEESTLLRDLTFVAELLSRPDPFHSIAFEQELEAARARPVYPVPHPTLQRTGSRDIHDLRMPTKKETQALTQMLSTYHAPLREVAYLRNRGDEHVPERRIVEGGHDYMLREFERRTAAVLSRFMPSNYYDRFLKHAVEAHVYHAIRPIARKLGVDGNVFERREFRSAGDRDTAYLEAALDSVHARFTDNRPVQEQSGHVRGPAFWSRHEAIILSLLNMTQELARIGQIAHATYPDADVTA